MSSWREPRAEFLKSLLDEQILPPGRQCDGASVGQRNRNLMIGPCTRILLLKSRKVIKVSGEELIELACFIGRQHLLGPWGDLVAVVRGVDWPVWVVRVEQGKSCIDELMERLTTDGLSGVRLVVAPVVLAQPSHQLHGT